MEARLACGSQACYYKHMSLSSQKSITISRKSVQEEDGVVVLPVGKYRELLLKTIPTYYLEGRGARNLDALVREGLRECNTGKTRRIASLAELD